MIEDQGTATPKYQAAGTPQSQNEDQIIFETGILKQRKQSTKNKIVKDAATHKKKVSSRRASLERLPEHNERYDTHDSTLSDANLSPRTRKNVKLARIVRLAFKKT